MSWKINSYDEHNPTMEITHGNRVLSFSLSSVDPKSHEWLGKVLDYQIEELVNIRVRDALDDHKKQLRELIGAK